MNYDLTEAEIAEWDRRTDPERDPDAAFADPVWRLANLYMCLEPGGQDVHFVPSPEQRTVIACIYMRGWLRIIIPKARQLGMSLLLCLIGLDGTVFREGFSGAWIDKTAPDAEKKLREKVKFAWKRIPEEIREALKVEKDTNEILSMRGPTIPGQPESPESTFTFGINFRGGTVEFLVISEWGTVQNDDRQRSREIKAGAVPAVERAEHGLCVIETTWKGGLDGELGPYVQEALTVPEADKGAKSWRILFFGWQSCAAYQQPHGYIDAESAKYFAEVAAAGVVLTREQQLWYAEKRRTATSAKTIKEEYPTLVHECWENIPQGSIYGKWIEEARTEGRITSFFADKRWPVHTFWDLGHPMNTVTWLMQITPQAIRVLDVLMEMDMTLEERAAWLRAKGWDYGSHFLPWDADEANTQSIKAVDEFRRVLGPTVRVVPKVRSVWDRISLTRGILPRVVFHSDQCKTGIEHLSRYRAERESSTGTAKDVPIHDRYSHAADAFGQMAQAIQGGLIEGANAVGGHTPSAPRQIVVKRAGAWA